MPQSQSGKPEKIYKTIARFRERFPGVEKKRYNSYTQSYYASIDDVWRVVEPVLTEVGLFVEQYTRAGVLYVTLHNRDGEQLTSDVQLPDSTDQFQKFGGALTYFRRYLVCLMLNVTEADHDDDGNVGEVRLAEAGIDQRQLNAVYDLINETGTDQRRLLDYIESAYGASKIEDLTYAQAAIVRRMLSQRLQRMQGRADG